VKPEGEVARATPVEAAAAEDKEARA